MKNPQWFLFGPSKSGYNKRNVMKLITIKKFGSFLPLICARAGLNKMKKKKLWLEPMAEM